MIKYIALIALTALVGCEAPAWVDTIFGAGDAGGPAPVEVVGSAFGPWGVAAGGLAASIYQTWSKKGVKDGKIQLIKDLGGDAYDKYGSFSKSDKEKLDVDIKAMVPAKYHKYYDMGKEAAKAQLS